MINYSIVFGFEKQFDDEFSKQWMEENWTRSFIFAGLYALVIFGGQQYMKPRPRFELRSVLTVWNSILALFSIFGTIRTLPEFIFGLQRYGFNYSVCDPSVFSGEVTGFWAWMFTLSKVPELGDTIFIILRKQPLIFLHWYHHVTVLVYSWYSYQDYTAPGRWFMVMNYVVHSIMYSYFTMKALRFKIPVSVSMFITTLQLAQMGIGCYLCVWTYQMKSQGRHCNQTFENLGYCFFMYFSYLLLFARFFYSSYMKKKYYRTFNGKKIQ